MSGAMGRVRMPKTHGQTCRAGQSPAVGRMERPRGQEEPSGAILQLQATAFQASDGISDSNN